MLENLASAFRRLYCRFSHRNGINFNKNLLHLIKMYASVISLKVELFSKKLGKTNWCFDFCII